MLHLFCPDCPVKCPPIMVQRHTPIRRSAPGCGVLMHFLRHETAMRPSISYSLAVNCRPQQRHVTCACCGLRPEEADRLGQHVKRRTRPKSARLLITAGDCRCSDTRQHDRTFTAPYGMTPVASHAGDLDNPRSATNDVSYLMQECGAVGSIVARQGKHGLGLFTTHGVSKGDVSHCWSPCKPSTYRMLHDHVRS